MENTLRHERPLSEGPSAQAVQVSLALADMPGRFEQLWAYESPEGGFVVASLPFFARGIAFGDLVEVSQPGQEVTRVVRQSGLRTVRACFTDRSSVTSRHEAVHGKIEALRLPSEWHGGGYVAVLVRSFEDQEAVLRALAPQLQAGIMVAEVEPEPFPCVADA